eukprot:m.123138 g.123138  ORF g.123138 m.123138 type:complete len:50 (-) comp13745_c0_seq11:882-1031(-)
MTPSPIENGVALEQLLAQLSVKDVISSESYQIPTTTCTVLQDNIGIKTK